MTSRYFGYASRAKELLKPLPMSRIKRLINLPPDSLVRVYSYQGDHAMTEFERVGYFSGNAEYIESDDETCEWFHPPYRWMHEQMAQRIPDFSGDYPIWAWFKRPSSKPKPRKYRGTNDRFRISALVPRKRILISDYELWHMPLNRGPICVTEAEYDSWPHGKDTKEIEATWPRVFEFPEILTPEQKFWIGNPSNYVLQACIDRIYAHEIVSVRSFDV